MRLVLIGGVVVLTALTFFAATRTLPTMDGSQMAAATPSGAAESEALLEVARAAYDEQAAELHQTIADLETQGADQATALEAAIAERTQLATNLEEAAANLAGIEAEKAALATSNSDLTDQLATLSAELIGQQAATGDVDTTVQALNDEIANGRDEILGLNDEIAKGQEEVQSLQATIADLEGESEALTLRVAELETNAAETPAAAAPDTQSAELESLLEQNAAELAAAEERIAMLTEMATVQVEVASDMTGEIEAFETQIATLTSEATTLADDVAKRDAVIAGLMAQTAAPTVSPVASCQEQSDAVLAGTQIGFDTGSASFTAASIPLLEALSGIAIECAQNGLTLEIEGHTDTSGGVASNLLLSDGRANAVREFLEANGVPAEAMRAVGFGGSDPIADNATSEGQAQNRRIIFDWEQS
jgi:outer membrane protein OmpA-like peptidoglycan-associated protein